MGRVSMKVVRPSGLWSSKARIDVGDHGGRPSWWSRMICPVASRWAVGIREPMPSVERVGSRFPCAMSTTRAKCVNSS